jgi:hypothetical protein
MPAQRRYPLLLPFDHRRSKRMNGALAVFKDIELAFQMRLKILPPPPMRALTVCHQVLNVGEMLSARHRDTSGPVHLSM